MATLKHKTADQVQTEKDEAEAQRIENSRRKAYEKEADPLFLQWKRGEATEQEWLDKIAEIKERFPKPV